MKTVFLDVLNGKDAEVIDIEDQLEAFYEKLDCRSIDIVQRKIGGKWFAVMCDEEGLFRDPQVVSAINDIGQPMFVGNLMFFHETKDGEIIGLSDDDIDHILRHIGRIYTRTYELPHSTLTECEF